MKELEQYFKALGDNSRLRIINLLLHGELCVCDIQYVLKTSQPNVSRHLSYLKNSGMVLDRRDGYRIYYRLTDPRKATKGLLYDFLREVFGDQEQLRSDTARLKEAIAGGSCTVSEWKPYSAIGKSKAGRALRQSKHAGETAPAAR
jgi:ArsR family transcriptional regulator, arsenate/arsenite/antimonite-responsive transcriptional repressor